MRPQEEMISLRGARSAATSVLEGAAEILRNYVGDGNFDDQFFDINRTVLWQYTYVETEEAIEFQGGFESDITGSAGQFASKLEAIAVGLVRNCGVRFVVG